MKKVLLWVIVGTKGGYNRARIIKALHDRPLNNNQLHNQLNLNYKTVNHHLNVLEKMGVITSLGENYGKLFLLSDNMEDNYGEFEEIWKQIKK